MLPRGRKRGGTGSSSGSGGGPGARARAAALALVLLCGWAAAAAAGRPAELSNSFIITSLQDLEPASIRGAWVTPCEYAVRRARGLDQRHFSIVVTVHWAGGAAGVWNYAFKDVSTRYNEGVGWPQPTAANVEAWKRGLQRCFKAAVDAGFSGLQILNHIDSQEHTLWRNFANFDPLAKYGGWSYEDVVVRPASDALRVVMKPGTKVWFMVSGEMGHSIWRHPHAYLSLIGKYRNELSQGKPAGTVKVGVAIHWNKVCGNCFPMPHVNSPALYNTTYHELFVAQKKQLEGTFDVPAIRRVFSESDVLGISHYAPAPQVGLTSAAFAMPIDTAAYELGHWGIDLPRLVNRADKQFLFSEVGLGGGDPNNQRAATNLEELAGNPLYGIWAVYNIAQDPWRNSDYKSYRRQWFKALMAFLQEGGGPRYKVDAAFIWSVGTWDVAAIHPISTSEQGTYADWEVVKWMRWLSAQAGEQGQAVSR